METTVYQSNINIFHKYLDLLISSILNNYISDDTAIAAKTQEEIQDMVNRLVDTGRKYGKEINIETSEVMRVSGRI